MPPDDFDAEADAQKEVARLLDEQLHQAVELLFPGPQQRTDRVPKITIATEVLDTSPADSFSGDTWTLGKGEIGLTVVQDQWGQYGLHFRRLSAPVAIGAKFGDDGDMRAGLFLRFTQAAAVRALIEGLRTVEAYLEATTTNADNTAQVTVQETKGANPNAPT